METTILKNVSLLNYNTLRIESIAEIMAFPHNEMGLQSLIRKYSDRKKIIVIGKGSNLLLSKAHYDKSIMFINLSLMNNITLKENIIDVQCGATLSELSWFAVEKNIKGFEFLEDIPGTVGGAIIMNAGTHKNCISNMVKAVKYYDYKTNSIIDRVITDDDFSKRSSYWMHNKSVVVSCKLIAEAGNYIESLNEILEIKRNRFMKQPRNLPSAGSVFVRPNKDLKDMVVWELLDKVGLRGYSQNGASFSEKHPGFIVNNGGAKYEDIIFLIKIAQTKVKKIFDVDLMLEWRII